jgi:hypothetical protein
MMLAPVVLATLNALTTEPQGVDSEPQLSVSRPPGATKTPFDGLGRGVHDFPSQPGVNPGLQAKPHVAPVQVAYPPATPGHALPQAPQL